MDCTDGKYIFGTVKVGERGQIVIPKDARNIFGIKSGDLVLVVGDEKRGIGIVKADKFKKIAMKILDSINNNEDD
ncbi:MAG: AbrB/MazE/SpoVT family DNA-binding domain-containing protein [Methanosarcinales archaeon]|nr:AbrB/MazE/SpoVT family DNA-binding domain-containing protein [Methanosarcinales archaeon]